MVQGYALTNNVVISAVPDIAVEIAADFADAIVQHSLSFHSKTFTNSNKIGTGSE